MTAPWQAIAGGIRLALRVTPNARRDAFDSMASDSEGRPVLKLRLAAPPVEGAANAALIAFLAATLGVRKADVTIEAGETSRLKRVRIAGDGDALAARLSSLAQG